VLLILPVHVSLLIIIVASACCKNIRGKTLFTIIVIRAIATVSNIVIIMIII
jgi:hypothetical protein